MTYERTGFGLTCAPPLPNGCYKIDRLKRFHFIADARTERDNLKKTMPKAAWVIVRLKNGEKVE